MLVAPEKLSGLKYNKDINIATANTRFTKRWKNQTKTISDFVTKLNSPVKTDETIKEYLRLPKPEQDNLKDQGGYVLGSLKSGLRNKESIANKSALCFDVDYAKSDTLSVIKEKLKDVCYTLHSTRKHTPEKPRYRLIIYPDTVLLPEQFVAVARKIAEQIDIELFDPASFKTNQFMYYPSISSDGEFILIHNDAKFLNVKDTLASYGNINDWQDVTLWPTSSRENAHIKKLAGKQADPLTKKGIVGALCRNVSMKDALRDYLWDVYRQESKDRYTYLDGSTVNGAVVYNDKFIYSNHSTDPAHGQTCNAFDIIRIHKFGHLDDGIDPAMGATRKPSFKAMDEFCRGMDGIKADLIKSGLEVSADDFDSFGKTDEGVDWTPQLEMTAIGAVKPTWANLVIILRNDKDVPLRPKFNKFTMMVESKKDSKQWEDKDTYRLKEYVGRKYNIDVSTSKFEESIDHVARESSYHPIHNYLESLEWDGVERIERIFIDYMGAEDNLYTREAALCWFSAAVHRVYHPGHKFDYVVVLGGAQGVLKTTFVRMLGKNKWFGELSSFDPKIAMEEIHGKWVIEMAELSAMNKQEIEQQKSFLSAEHTRVRMAYARRAIEFKRQCVFMGTTNNHEYLKDTTGNRRWWPIDVNVDKIDMKLLKSEIDQIWAEAHQSLYLYGKRTYLSDEAELIAKEAQASKLMDDEWQGVIEAWLEDEVCVDRYDEKGGFGSETHVRRRVCIPEIWEDCLGKTSDMRRIDKLRISSVMDNMKGWKRHSTIRFGRRFGRQRGWWFYL